MSNPVTEPIIAPAAAQVVETPTEQADPVEALKVTETHEAPATPEEPTAEVPPHPTPSKSNTTKRLSIFLGKAKNYVDKKVHEKKPTSPKKEVAEPVELTAEPTVETAVVDPVVEATVEPTVEPTAAAAEEAPVEEAKPKSEKRKSILAGIFRSKVMLDQGLFLKRNMYHEQNSWCVTSPKSVLVLKKSGPYLIYLSKKKNYLCTHTLNLF